MKVFALLLVFAAGCTDDGDEFPVLPAGGGFVGTGGAGNAPMLRGRVCVIDELSSLGCQPAELGGLTVSLGSSTATTAADGSFELPPPRGSLLAFTVSGPGAVTTTTPYSPSPFVPVIDADVWARTLASNSITLPPNTGSLLGTVVQGGQPATGVSVATTPTSAFGPFYDADTGFALDGTGARGVFLAPGITTGTSSLAFSPGETTVAGIPVINGGVTILDSMVLP